MKPTCVTVSRETREKIDAVRGMLRSGTVSNTIDVMCDRVIASEKSPVLAQASAPAREATDYSDAAIEQLLHAAVCLNCGVVYPAAAGKCPYCGSPAHSPRRAAERIETRKVAKRPTPHAPTTAATAPLKQAQKRKRSKDHHNFRRGRRLGPIQKPLIIFGGAPLPPPVISEPRKSSGTVAADMWQWKCPRCGAMVDKDVESCPHCAAPEEGPQ